MDKLEQELQANNRLKAELNNNKGVISDLENNSERQKTLLDEFKAQIQELTLELANSEESRADLKQDLGDANDKIIQLEEELYESKQIQLELLENIN